MKRSLVFGIILLILVLVGISIIDANVKKPINWKESFSFKDKIPFGMYVYRQELPNILGKEKSFTDFGHSFYELINSFDSVDTKGITIIDIGDTQYPSDVDINKIIDFVSSGGEMFLSGRYIDQYLLDTLGLYSDILDYSKFKPNFRNVSYSFVNDTSKIHLEKVINFPVFSKLNAKTTTILGYLNCRGRSFPNFIKLKLGQGSLYLHLAPHFFTNYYMLQEDSYKYASTALGFLEGNNIWLSHSDFYWGEPRTPLRVILKNEGFAEAWYLLLFGLIMLLIFKSKREQRAVPIIIPEPNKSKEFAKTIGNLYYENGTSSNIIQKKIEYFLFDIRNNYQLDTLKLNEEKFMKQLSLKSGVSMVEVTEIIQLLLHYRLKDNCTVEEVKLINKRIEEFKHKANLI